MQSKLRATLSILLRRRMRRRPTRIVWSKQWILREGQGAVQNLQRELVLVAHLLRFVILFTICVK